MSIEPIKFSNCNCKITPGQFSINHIPLNCPAVWRLFAGGHTVGIFQLEKKLGQDWAKKVKPQNIDELAALVSLLRPGPMEAGMSQDYVDIKFGKKKPVYLHPSLKPILEPTYGCMVYQEQALKIASELAGFKLEEADELRKAIGKKLPELMAKMKNRFIDGCQKHKQIGRGIAEEIFGWIEKCQRYSFNKSHAVSYAMIAYQTCWLKCHFPHEFFTSYLTFSSYKGDPKDEIYRLVQDARFFGINILPPDIRRGNINFIITEEPQRGIAFGLAHIRGVGQAAIQNIVNIDKDKDALEYWNGFLSSVPDFHRNVGIALIKAGACDYYNMGRNEMVRELEAILGTTTRDDNGNKVEIKGLTEKEKAYFFKKLKEGHCTIDILQDMVKSPEQMQLPLSQMKKEGLVATAQKYFKSLSREIKDNDDSVFVYTTDQEKDTWISELSKRTKDDLKKLLLKNGYKDEISKPPCSTEARRQKIAEKIQILQQPISDTNIANAIAEKYFLGISLSCSAADDADDSMATHTCLEVAKAQNEAMMTVCAIIDDVKHTKTKRGNNPGQSMCFLTISDSTYSIDHAVVFPDAYEELKAFCKDDLIGLISGEKKKGSFIISDIKKLI